MAFYLQTTSPLSHCVRGQARSYRLGQGVSKLYAAPIELLRGISNFALFIVGARLPAMASYLQATSPLAQPFAGKRGPTEWGQDVSKDQTAPNSISPRRVETLGAPLEPVRGM